MPNALRRDVRLQTISRDYVENELLRRCVLGHSLQSIAVELGYPLETLQQFFGKKDFQQRLQDFRDRAEAKIENFLETKLKDAQVTLQLCTEEMIEIILSIARNPQERGQTRLAAACEALDRAQVLQKKVHDTGMQVQFGFSFSSQIREASKLVSREVHALAQGAEAVDIESKRVLKVVAE